MTSNLAQVRQEFSLLNKPVNNQILVYLDNAATTLTPHAVVKRINDYYLEENANIHRGVHYLSEKATASYESTREVVQKFISAKSQKEIIFTSGTTASINLVAYSYGLAKLQPGDEIILSEMEHHSNLVPWQIIAEKTKAKLKIIPLQKNGEINYDGFTKLLSSRTKLVSLVYVSNSLGTINPVKKIISASHKWGALVLLDGAQAVAHLPINVQELDVDFFAFSGHKLFGPTGVGVLYGKEAILEKMSPFLGGGDMISQVTLNKSTYKTPPHKFEAGTPPIAEVMGLGAGINWFKQFNLTEVREKETSLLKKAEKKLKAFPEIEIIGQAPEKTAVISFTIKGVHPHDIGSLLDQNGIAIRAGHHCTQPVMDFFKIPATARASLSLYNNDKDITKLEEGIKKVINFFK